MLLVAIAFNCACRRKIEQGLKEINKVQPMLKSEMIAKHPYENKHNIQLISLMKGYLCSFSVWSHLCFMDSFNDSILTLTSWLVSNYETFSFCFPQKFLSEMDWNKELFYLLASRMELPILIFLDKGLEAYFPRKLSLSSSLRSVLHWR